ncbi:MAG: hypothetical protein ACOY94_06425 [Bacillota bacterium]
MITEVDATKGYIELSLFTPTAADLTGWTITTTAGASLLPEGSLLAPAQPLILTRNAAAFTREFGDYPNLVELPSLTLSPQRDRVELRSGPDLVDRLAWGGAMDGWTLSGRRTLCRNPAGQDTSSYLDWTLFSAPSPGAPGCGR